MRLFNAAGSDDGPHGFIGQSSGLLQLGLHGVFAGPPPLNSRFPYKDSFLGMDANGAVGTMELPFGQASSAANFRITLDDGAGLMKFGNTFGQKLTLASADFGIGAQANTLYSRSPGGFAWYRGGLHSDTEGDSGGIAALMTLTQNGDLSVPRNITANNLPGVNFGSASYADTIRLVAGEDPRHIEEISIRTPAAGYLLVIASLPFSAAAASGLTLYLDDVSSGTPVNLASLYTTGGTSNPQPTIYHVLPVSGVGFVNLRMTASTGGADALLSVGQRKTLIAIYFPVRYN